MKYILLSALLFCSGCICLNPAHKKQEHPIVRTDKVIESLKQLKTDLDKAGEDSAGVDQKLDKALSLAEKLGIVLDQLDAMFSDGKTVIKPQL